MSWLPGKGALLFPLEFPRLAITLVIGGSGCKTRICCQQWGGVFPPLEVGAIRVTIGGDGRKSGIDRDGWQRALVFIVTLVVIAAVVLAAEMIDVVGIVLAATMIVKIPLPLLLGKPFKALVDHGRQSAGPTVISPAVVALHAPVQLLLLGGGRGIEHGHAAVDDLRLDVPTLPTFFFSSPPSRQLCSWSQLLSAARSASASSSGVTGPASSGFKVFPSHPFSPVGSSTLSSLPVALALDAAPPSDAAAASDATSDAALASAVALFSPPSLFSAILSSSLSSSYNSIAANCNAVLTALEESKGFDLSNLVAVPPTPAPTPPAEEEEEALPGMVLEDRFRQGQSPPPPLPPGCDGGGSSPATGRHDSSPRGASPPHASSLILRRRQESAAAVAVAVAAAMATAAMVAAMTAARWHISAGFRRYSDRN